MRKSIKNIRKQINFKDKIEETNLKYEETVLNFEETDQQIEIFKVFEKSGNGSKYEKTDLKNKRKPFIYKYWEMDTKYSEIPQQFWIFEGFPRISKQKTEIPLK